MWHQDESDRYVLHVRPMILVEAPEQYNRLADASLIAFFIGQTLANEKGVWGPVSQ